MILGKKAGLLLTLCAALALSACASPAPNDQNATKESGEQTMITTVSPEDVKAKIEEGSAIILDVRTPEEYKQAHLPGAKLLTNETISEDTAAVLLPQKDAQIIVYCRSGARSAQAAQKLVKLGYTHIMDMGGILHWPYDTQAGEWQP